MFPVRTLLPLALSLVATATLGCNESAKSPLRLLGKSTKEEANMPSAEKEGMVWTHKELLEYLERQGVVFTNVSYFDIPVPTVILVGYANAPQGSALSDRVAFVALEKTIEIAREQAGIRGNARFAWGRFVFEAPNADSVATFLPELEHALRGKKH